MEEISNPELKTLYESVPDALKLQFESEGNYGIPYNIEGYGLIADRQMLEDILGVTDLNAFTADYKEADYEEFQQMIVALNDYTTTASLRVLPSTVTATRHSPIRRTLPRT